MFNGEGNTASIFASVVGAASGSNGVTLVPMLTIVVPALVAGLTAWLAFRGRRINPLENGAAFLSTEARNLAEFHREDAAAMRLERDKLHEQLMDAAARLAVCVCQYDEVEDYES